MLCLFAERLVCQWNGCIAFQAGTASLRELKGGENSENPILFSALTFYSLLVYKHAETGGGWRQRGGKKTKKERYSLILC